MYFKGLQLTPKWVADIVWCKVWHVFIKYPKVILQKQHLLIVRGGGHWLVLHIYLSSFLFSIIHCSWSRIHWPVSWQNTFSHSFWRCCRGYSTKWQSGEKEQKKNSLLLEGCFPFSGIFGALHQSDTGLLFILNTFPKFKLALCEYKLIKCL